MPTDSPTRRPPFFAAVRQNLVSIIASLILVAATTIWFINGYHGPEIVSADAPENQFSAERAIECLKTILDGESSHPAGSVTNQEVRKRLIQQIESVGLQVEERRFATNGVQMCNLLTSIPGNQDMRPILLATHYDSVEQGPGAGDAGSCVAALLEVARTLNIKRQSGDEELLNREVFFLFTDGEEWVRKIGHGLNGAIQFVETNPHPLLSRNPIVLNFDARGAAGPSLLYETSADNFDLIANATAALPRPAFTASSYVTVYELLPNATDFTIFKQAGLDGLNFAFIDDPHRYHTPEDSLANLDPRCIQHHGENALAIVEHLLQVTQEDLQSQQDAVFFTVFNHWVVSYPESYAVLLASLLLGVQICGVWNCGKRAARIGESVRAVLLIFLSLMLSTFAGWVVMQLDGYRIQSFHGFGPYDPWIVGFQWLFGIVSSVIVFAWLGRNISAESAWVAVWLSAAVTGLLVSVFFPGFSYLFLGVGVVPAVLSFLPGDKTKLSVIAITAASIFLVPMAYQFGIALGPKMAMVLGFIFVLFLCPIVPLLVQTQPKSRSIDAATA